MTAMNAAVVTSFDEPPHYRTFAEPQPVTEAQSLVDVVAVGLHPRTRSGAAGAHYTSTGTLPMIPGVDAVGRRADGTLLYFAADDEHLGTMAERAVVDPRRAIVLPADADAVAIAATMNPAMSSWIALRRRAPIQPGQSVLVLGATGNAGAMAVQIAKLLGAGRVVAAGRNVDRLHALGADATVALTDDIAATDEALGAAAGEVDIVLDYLWGDVAARTMVALITHRVDRSRLLDWVQIGSVAGATLELPSAALRSANLRLQGNGQGAVSPRAYLAELPSLVEQINAGAISLATRIERLANVERVWLQPEEPGVRTVFVP